MYATVFLKYPMGSTGDMLKVVISTRAAICIGIAMFVTLIILLVILWICIRRRRRKRIEQAKNEQAFEIGSTSASFTSAVDHRDADKVDEESVEMEETDLYAPLASKED